MLDANWLLTWSHHVLYTNMVEPLLRFLLVSRGYVLLHCAAIDAEPGRVDHVGPDRHGEDEHGPAPADAAQLGLHLATTWRSSRPAARSSSYPKPMTPQLAHDERGQRPGAAAGRPPDARDPQQGPLQARAARRATPSAGCPCPIVTINAWVQLIVPPPKYHVQSLIDCDLTERAPIDAVILMERGPQPLAEEPSFAFTVERLLENTDDAYTFPPFATFAPLIELQRPDHAPLREHERELLEARRPQRVAVRVRVVGHNWSELVPILLEQPRAQFQPDELAAAAREADVAVAAEIAAAEAPVGAGRSS